MPRPINSRNWCFTLNNWTELELKRIDEYFTIHPSEYCIYGKETAESGTRHLQGYVHLKDPRAASYVKKIVPRAHIEKCKGSPAENIAYCCKDGDTTTYGVEPQTQQQVNKDKAKRFIELAKTGDFSTIEEEMPGKFLQQYRTMHQIATDHMVKPADLDQVCGLWIYGDTGCGKTTKARTEYGEYYSKPANKWWDGYKGQDTVIIEDLDPNHKCLGHHLKLWTDKWSFPAEVKGGMRCLRPKRVIITSQYSINEVFVGETSTIAALERRCSIIFMSRELTNQMFINE